MVQAETFNLYSQARAKGIPVYRASDTLMAFLVGASVMRSHAKNVSLLEVPAIDDFVQGENKFFFPETLPASIKMLFRSPGQAVGQETEASRCCSEAQEQKLEIGRANRSRNVGIDFSAIS